jgi:hypothetical protein
MFAYCLFIIYTYNSEQWEYIRIDPEFSWLAKFEFSLAPYMWSNLLEESIDVIDHYKVCFVKV